jgi:outer membrane protein assembly factor BamB
MEVRKAHIRGMRKLVIGCALAVAACKGSDKAPPATATGSGSAVAETPSAPVVVPPGMGVKPELPAKVDGYRKVDPRKMRHSSVRGDFRIYKTSAGILVAWKHLLSARSLDGKSLWKKDDQGRAVAVSADGSKIVTNNDTGDLMILDAKTGNPIGAATKLGGSGDEGHPDVYISAFAWTPDGKHILALDSKHVYVLGADGKVERELKIACKENDCFFTSAAALSNDEAIISSAAGTSTGQLMRVKLADGTASAVVDYYGHDVDLAADKSLLIADGSQEVAAFDPKTLKQVWSVRMPGFAGLQSPKSTEGSYVEFKPVPKLSPDGKYVVTNDNAGQLWLLDARSGAPVVAYPTQLVDFVEDAMFADGATLIVIDNPGNVMAIAGTPAKKLWSEKDAPDGGEWDDL